MNLVRTVILAVLAFGVPIGIALVSSPFLFKNAISTPHINSDALLNDKQLGDAACIEGMAYEGESCADGNSQALQVSEGSGRYASIDSSPELNPSSDNYFVVSFLVRFYDLPQDRQRHNIIEKYDSEHFPYPGWAIGITKINGLIRPQVYWRDGYGHGGWFTFDSFDCTVNNWYAVTLVTRGNQYLSVYVEPFGERLTSPTGASSWNISDRHASSRVVFLGGHPTFDVAPPATGALLELAVTKANGKSFKGDVELFLVAAPREFGDDVTHLQDYLSGGPLGLRSQLKATEVAISINSTWRDESQYAREIKRSA